MHLRDSVNIWSFSQKSNITCIPPIITSFLLINTIQNFKEDSICPLSTALASAVKSSANRHHYIAKQPCWSRIQTSFSPTTVLHTTHHSLRPLHDVPSGKCWQPVVSSPSPSWQPYQEQLNNCDLVQCYVTHSFPLHMNYSHISI